MRVHSSEPSLPWPSDRRRISSRDGSSKAAASDWSSETVARSAQPLARVAALLLSISQNNSYEGRDPAAVPDELSSGFVADLLGVDVATLAALLVDLRRRGLVECSANSTLRLADLRGLQQLAN